MKEMVQISHNDYEKVSDTVLWLSNEYVLKFNVELNRHNDKKGKINFHSEYGYTMNGEYRVNIMRTFSYYLSIESVRRDMDGYKAQVRIGPENIYFLKYKLHEVVLWFTSKNHSSLFVKKDGKIIILEKIPPISVHVQYGQYLEFEPAVQIINNNEQVIGIRIYLNSDGVSFFISANTVLSLCYCIDTFNMYQSAQLMLNYLGRPENGTNYAGYDSAQSSYNKKGFFERVNAENKNIGS